MNHRLPGFWDALEDVGDADRGGKSWGGRSAADLGSVMGAVHPAREKEMNALRRLASAALVAPDWVSLAPLVAAEVAHTLDAPVVVVERYHWEAGCLECLQAHGLSGSVWVDGSRLLGENSPSQLVVRRGAPVRTGMEQAVEGAPLAHAYLGYPLRGPQGIIGVLSVFTPTPVDALDSAEAFVANVAALLRTTAEKMHADFRVRQREREVEAIYDHAPFALCLLDERWRIRRFNRAMVRLAGRSAESLEGRRAGEVLGCDRAGVGRCGSGEESACAGCPLPGWLERAVRLGQRTDEQELEIPVVNGQGRAVRVLGVSVARMEVEGHVRLLLCLQDQTDRKRLEQELIRAHRLEAVGALASGISHDLNNVLTPVVLGTDLLMDEAPEDATRDMLGMIKGCARRGSDLLRQLLTFARGSSAERGVVEIRSILQEIHRMVREVYPRTIECGPPQVIGACRVQGNATQIHQVLLNLCVNARDAMLEGGRLTLSATEIRQETADLPAHGPAQPGPYVQVTVSDTGCGMAPELLQRIFEPYFSTKASGQGTGLGLATSKTIIENHAGCLRVESRVGHGTTFHVLLPAVLEPVPEIPTELISGFRGRGECVLLVDDEAAILEAARRVLSNHGYEVLTASRAAVALQVMQTGARPVAVLITDVMMPGDDGVTLIRKVREAGWDTRVIAATGLDDPDLKGQLQELPVDALLPKPFSGRELLRAVSTVLGAVGGATSPSPAR